MMHWLNKRSRMALAICWALAVAGCGDGGSGGTATTPQALREAIPEHGDAPGPQADVTYVGRVDGSDALIAVIANERAAVAYVCDGSTLSEWFLGTPTGATLALPGEKGGRVDATIAGDSVAGEVESGGVAAAFSTTVAIEGESGIYRSVEREAGERIVSTWIFYDGELRGADENRGKTVVGTVSVSGIDDATGSGTGLGVPAPTPVPQETDCGELWCQHESQRCFIGFMSEERQNLKGKKLRQALAMIAAAQKRLNEIGTDLAVNNCGGGLFSCPGTGYDNANDTPNCG